MENHNDKQLRRLAPMTLSSRALHCNFYAFPFFPWSMQKLDVEPQRRSSSEGSTVDIRPLGDGVDSVELEPEESLDPEACFTEGEADVRAAGGGNTGRRGKGTGWTTFQGGQEITLNARTQCHHSVTALLGRTQREVVCQVA